MRDGFIDGTMDGLSDDATIGCSDGTADSLAGTSDDASLDGILERNRGGTLVGKSDNLLYSGAESDGMCDGEYDSDGLFDGIEVGGLMHLTPRQISPGQHCGEAFL